MLDMEGNVIEFAEKSEQEQVLVVGEDARNLVRTRLVVLWRRTNGEEISLCSRIRN